MSSNRQEVRTRVTGGTSEVRSLLNVVMGRESAELGMMRLRG